MTNATGRWETMPNQTQACTAGWRHDPLLRTASGLVGQAPASSDDKIGIGMPNGIIAPSPVPAARSKQKNSKNNK